MSILERLLIMFFPQSVFRGFLDSRSKHVGNQIILCTDCRVSCTDCRAIYCSFMVILKDLIGYKIDVLNYLLHLNQRTIFLWNEQNAEISRHQRALSAGTNHESKLINIYNLVSKYYTLFKAY